MAREGYIFGGLLAGLGQGLAQHAQQMRDDALLKLRRQWQQEDVAAAQKQTLESEQRAEERDVRTDARRGTDLAGRTGLLALAQRYKMEEGETEQAYRERLERIRQGNELEQIGARGAEDRKTAQTKGQIDRSLEAFKFGNEKQMVEIKAAIEGDLVHGTEVAEDGSLVVLFKGGKKVRLKEKLRASGSAGGTGSVLGDFGQTGTPTPSPTPARSSTAPAKADVAQQDIDALWTALETVPAPTAGQPTTRTMTGPNGKKVRIKWTGQRWQPDGFA